MNKSIILDAERAQAEYFGYKPLGLFGRLLPKRVIKWYAQKRYNEQDPAERNRFCRLIAMNKRKKNRMLRRVREGARASQ